MKKQSVLAMVMILGLTGGTSFPAQAAGAYSLNEVTQSKNCVVIKAQVKNMPEIKSTLEEWYNQLQNGNWKDCPTITLPDCNPSGTPETSTPDGDNNSSDGTGVEDENQSGGNQTGTPDNNQSGDNQTEMPDDNQTGTPDSNKPNDSDMPEEDSEQPEINQENLTYTEQILKLVNEERAKAGLHALELDTEISAAAQTRAKEIQTSFSHTRPDGRKFSSVLTDNGIRFTGAGENIAWGQTSPEKVMEAWMNSEGHRANILNAKFTKLGVGHLQNVSGRNYWVQLFTY